MLPPNPAIPTVSVLCEAATQDGSSVEGFRIVARLTALETYEGLVVPEETEGTFDANGQCVLQLWPNALGVAGSAYRITATDASGRRWLNTTAVVPNSACRLEQIIVAEPYPAVDAAQQALIAAQGALAPVTAQAQAAAASALVAQDAEDGALAAETAAQASAAAAQASEQAAAASQDSASGHASAAAGSALTAITAADEAEAASAAAQAAATTATTNAGEASTSSSLATAKAGEAATSAAAAAADRVQTGLDTQATAADRVQTGLDAATATEQAGIATTKATESATSASASQASANAAASAVVSQLTDLKTQTEYARDQALAGLGAADNSQSLAALLGAIAYVTDLALKGADGVAENRGTFRETDRAELYALMFGELLGKIGVIGRAVAGGAIALGAGTAGNPSLAQLTDENTGLFFPAADVLALVTAGLERLRLTADGRLGLGTTTPTGVLDVADNKLRVRSAQTPASATAAGNQGEIAWDANFVYVCTATNTWRRAALSTW